MGLKAKLQALARPLHGRRERLVTTPSRDNVVSPQSPAQAMLRLIEMLIDNRRHPTHSDLLALKRMLETEEDLRKPIALQQQLLADDTYEDEVKLAMVELLVQRPEAPRMGHLSRDLLRDAGEHLIDVLDPSLVRLLGEADAWAYDIFALSDATRGRPLAPFAFWALCQLGCVEALSLDSRRLMRFLTAVESSYDPELPYHNNVHAADVCQKIYVLLAGGGRRGTVEDKESCAAAVLAAAVHDFGHVGVTNAFLVATEHPLAITYSDASPLEHYHLAGAFALLKKDDMNFLRNTSRDVVRRIRASVISMVLSTDMTRHSTLMGQIEASLKGERSGGKREPLPSWVLRLAIKIADVGHCLAAQSTHARWVERLDTEMRAQGAREREIGLPVSPLMAPEGPGVKASQVAFFSVVILPMMAAVIEAFPAATPWLDLGLVNFSTWCEKDSARAESEGDPHQPSRSQRATSSTTTRLIQRVDGQRGVLRVAEAMARQLAEDFDRVTARRLCFLYLCKALGEISAVPPEVDRLDARRMRRLAESAVTVTHDDPLLASDVADRL